MADFIPRTDEEFAAWVTNFDTLLTAAPTAYGETAGTAAAIHTAVTDFLAQLAATVAAQAAAASQAAQKETSKGTLILLIRTMVKRMQIYSGMTDSKRTVLQITVPDTTHTAAGIPTSRPIIQVDTRDRLRHIINFADEGTPTLRAKPAGVLGVELWIKIGGAPPTDHTECTYLATDTSTPYRADFEGAQGNETAHYMARWVNTRHEPGPWSTTVSATIGA